MFVWFCPFALYVLLSLFALTWFGFGLMEERLAMGLGYGLRLGLMEGRLAVGSFLMS